MSASRSLDSSGALRSIDSSSAGAKTVKLFYIVLEGATKEEKIGCNDRTVALNVEATNVEAPLRFALERLLANREPSPAGAGRYNALKHMVLKIDSIEVKSDTAVIGLSGKFTYGGVCDAPRIQAQLTRTATQFPTVRVASFYINGRPLSEHLSEK